MTLFYQVLVLVLEWVEKPDPNQRRVGETLAQEHQVGDQYDDECEYDFSDGFTERGICKLALT